MHQFEFSLSAMAINVKFLLKIYCIYLFTIPHAYAYNSKQQTNIFIFLFITLWMLLFFRILYIKKNYLHTAILYFATNSPPVEVLLCKNNITFYRKFFQQLNGKDDYIEKFGCIELVCIHTKCCNKWILN